MRHSQACPTAIDGDGRQATGCHEPPLSPSWCGVFGRSRGRKAIGLASQWRPARSLPGVTPTTNTNRNQIPEHFQISKFRSVPPLRELKRTPHKHPVAAHGVTKDRAKSRNIHCWTATVACMALSIARLSTSSAPPFRGFSTLGEKSNSQHPFSIHPAVAIYSLFCLL